MNRKQLYKHYILKNKSMREISKILKCSIKFNGYKSLVVWEHKLKDLDKLKKKIGRFHLV